MKLFIKIILLCLLPIAACNAQKTLNMIGDSIISSRYGNSIRYELNNKGFGYDFIGTFVDPYGFSHDAYPGFTTVITLNRIDEIPKAYAYFILLGINDVNIKSKTALDTKNNLMLIARKLYEKNNFSIIYISTLLPVDGKEEEFSENVNKLLRNGIDCMNCLLLDLGRYFKSQENWQSLLLDGVHPNENGNKLIIEYLFSNIN